MNNVHARPETQSNPSRDFTSLLVEFVAAFHSESIEITMKTFRKKEKEKK